MVQPLTTPDPKSGVAAAQVIAAIAEIELPLNQWNILIQTLLNNVTQSQNSTHKQASLQAIGFICETIVSYPEGEERAKRARILWTPESSRVGVGWGSLSDSEEFLLSSSDRVFEVWQRVSELLLLLSDQVIQDCFRVAICELT